MVKTCHEIFLILIVDETQLLAMVKTYAVSDLGG